MRWSQFAILILLWSLAGCRGLPQPSPLPEAHQVPVGQLVFHSDFELPRDHRLVRELTLERDDMSNTLGLPPTNEPIEVYLFRDADAIANTWCGISRACPRGGRFSSRPTRGWPCTPIGATAWRRTCGTRLPTDICTRSIPDLPLWVDEGLAEYFEVPRGLRAG